MAAGLNARTQATQMSPLLMAYVTGVVLLAGVALGAAMVPLVRAAQALTPQTMLTSLALMAGFFLLQRRSIIQEWRGHRVTLALDEAILFTALLFVPAVVVVPLVLASMTCVQVAAKRMPVKAVFNVAAYTLAAAVGVATSVVATDNGVAPVVAALLAVTAYAFASNLLVSGIFALLERTPIWRIFHERFLLPSFVNIALGGSLGLTVLALWSLHPATLTVLIPFVYFAHRYALLNAQAEREILVRDRLASMTRDTGNAEDWTNVVAHVLRTSGELLHAGRVVVRLRMDDGEERVWSEDFEGGVDEGTGSIHADLVGRDGRRLGALEAYPSRRTKETYAEVESKLLRVVAAQAAAALEAAKAHRERQDILRRHNEFVETVPTGVAYLDARGRMLHANRALRESAGEIPDDAFALPFVAASPELARAVAGLLQGRGFEDVEIRTPSGGYLSVTGLRLSGNERAEAVLLFRDVTDRRRADEAIRAQTLTRPLVRRIVQNLVKPGNLSNVHTTEAGRSLAREVQAHDAEGYAQAFRTMGLGDLRFGGEDRQTFTFQGDDLLERRKGATQPTCQLALGFAEGAVASLHGGALGAEVRCQSQGHDACVFVVKARPPKVATPAGRG